MRKLSGIAQFIGLATASFACVIYFTWVYLDYKYRGEAREISPEDCPIFAWLHPIDHKPIQPTDWIELKSWSTGPLLFEPFHVKIYANGEIERDTVETVRTDQYGCPMESADKTTQVSAEVATKLIARARDGGFCWLCGSYHPRGRVFDAGTEIIELSINGEVKSVSDSAGNAPPLFRELSDAVGKLSPMDQFTDHRKFSPQRAKKCEGFLEAQENDRLKRKKPNEP